MLPTKNLSLVIIGLLFYSCGPSASQEPAGASMPLDTLKNYSVKKDVKPKSEHLPVPISFVMGQFDPAKDSNFVKIDPQYTSKKDIYLHKAAYKAFVDMSETAQKEGINLRILSATRNFYAQKSIWEGKWTGQRILSDGTNAATEIKNEQERALRILEYSSMPGTSRHHWGTDIDLNALNNAHFEEGEGLKVYNWLRDHAIDFGFCQPYTEKGKDRPDGYNEEKWHWSYLPLARQYLQTAKDSLKNTNISGFKGAEVAPQIKVVEKYVLGINAACQ